MLDLRRLTGPLTAGARIDTPERAEAEGWALALEARVLDERADELDPGRFVAPVTDLAELGGLAEAHPGRLRGIAELLRDSARQMHALVPAWREAREQLAAEHADRP